MDNTLTRTIFFDRSSDVGEPSSDFPINDLQTDTPELSAGNTNTSIDWEGLYPFKKNDIPLTTVRPPDAFEKYKSKITGLEEKIEKYTKEWLINRINFVEIAYRYEMLLGWISSPVQSETLIALDDGHLVDLISKSNDIPEYAANLYMLNNFLVQQGIDFLYIQCPYKISKNDIPIAGISDFSNENADELLSVLSSKNIPFLDLRKSIQDEELNHRNLFYKTDHHWKAETGLWAAKIICARLNTYNQFKIDTGLFSPDQYRYSVYKNWFLGSWGKKLTLARTSPEDISLIYPAFDTDFSLVIPPSGIERQGAFDIFYWYDHINQIDYYNLNPYATYLNGGYYPVMVIHNNLLNNGKQVLLIKDSFAITVVPFMALGIETIHILDRRDFTGSVKTYIEQYKPDMVMVMYNPMMLVPNPEWSTMFDFR
jgi:hypothetical protein